MPSYDFEVTNPATGEVLEIVAVNLPIALRDAVTFRRVTVPRRVVVMGSAPDNPNDNHRIDMRNLRRSEDKLGPNFERFYGRSKQEMRRLWSEPAPTKSKASA